MARVTMLEGMGGLNGVALPAAVGHIVGGSLTDVLAGLGVRFEAGDGVAFIRMSLWILGLAGIAFFFPNTQEIMRRYRPALDLGRVRRGRWDWRPSLGWAAASAFLLALGVLSLPEVSVFLYFQF